MKRFLPPLLVLVVLGVIVWRVAASPQRQVDRAWIESRWDVGPGGEIQPEQVSDAVDAYLEAYGRHPDDRWFAARAYFELGNPSSAARAILDDPALMDDPETARRFATLLLETLAFGTGPEGGGQEGPNVALLMLVEGGHEEATRRLDEAVAVTPMDGLLRLYHSVYRQSPMPIRRRMADGLRAREDADHGVAAAILAMGPDAWPERDADVGRLKDVVGGSSRRERRMMWTIAAVALGSSEDEAALDELRDLFDSLKAAENEEDREDGLMAAIGLLAGGDKSVLEDLAPVVELRGRNLLLPHQYVETLAHRYARGDDVVVKPLETIWSALAAKADVPPLYQLRPRAADLLLLRGELPRASLPVDKLLDELSGRAAHESERGVAAAFRWRRGEPEGKAGCVAMLKDLLGRGLLYQDPALHDPTITSPLLTTARALYLYDGSSDH